MCLQRVSVTHSLIREVEQRVHKLSLVRTPHQVVVLTQLPPRVRWWLNAIIGLQINRAWTEDAICMVLILKRVVREMKWDKGGIRVG